VHHTGGTIECDNVVLAFGAWVREAEQWIDWPIPVRPLHGEVLNVRLSGPPLKAFILTARHGPILQRKDGIILVGSLGGVTMSGMDVDAKHVFDPYDTTPPVFDLEPKEENAKFMIERALRVMPALEQADLVAHLAGVRPLSADRMPIIGRVPSVRGVVLATGHGTKGIHLAPVTARMVAELILNNRNLENVPADAFSPERFAPAVQARA
jgi:glycine/D-amino acid oxidase-like deaminating enzyme